ncbi:unnamed protein product [Coregonus sp. 'balchen']|nr:unnamed protein product [Coregonus sp. 'balchen']
MLTKHLAQVLDTLNMKALLIWAVLLNFYKLLKTGDCTSKQLRCVVFRLIVTHN